MNKPRAIRYRKLALAEQDARSARLLRLLADEAEQGLLCTSDWLRSTTKPAAKAGEGILRP